MPTFSQDDQKLIDRFLAAYNDIDRELRRRVKADTFTSFSQIVDQYATRTPLWNQGPTLKRYADLRNFIAHSPTKYDERLAVPTLQVVEGIEAINANLSERIFPKFKRDVTSFRPGDSLAQVLRTIKETSYSQFPVREINGEFKGLLTENGITRWLANHTVTEMAMIDLEDELVTTVVSVEENRANYIFVSRSESINDAFSRFARKPLLEALLITQNGKQNEKLLGIITRWDVLSHDMGR